MNLALKKGPNSSEAKPKRQEMRPHEIAAEARKIHLKRARREITPEDAEKQLSQLLRENHQPFLKRIFGY